MIKHLFAPTLLLALSASAEPLPQQIREQIPSGFVVFTYAAGYLNDDDLIDYLVVGHKPDEAKPASDSYADIRPLLIFTRSKDGSFVLKGRNDDVVFALDSGGQCDPFLNGYEGLVIKNHYFTVQNGVACGEHWTDFITFKYSPNLDNWVFHKKIYTSSNPLEDNKEQVSVHKSNTTTPILFNNYSIQNE